MKLIRYIILVNIPFFWMVFVFVFVFVFEAGKIDSDHQHPFLSICGIPQLNFMLGLKGCPREEEKK